MNSLIPNMTKEEILELRAKESVRGMSDIEKIREFYRNDLPIVLSDRQEEMRMKIDLCLRLQMQALPISKILLTLKKTFKYKNDRMPRVILKNTNFVYGDTMNTDKNIKRAVAEEMALKTYLTSKRNKDTKGMNDALSNYIKIWALQNEEVENPYEEGKLKQSVYAIVLDEELRKILMGILSRGSINLNNLIDNVYNIEDAQID